VVAVGATDAKRKVPKWSPEPEKWPWVNVLATGENVTSTYIDGKVALKEERKEFEGFATWSGTSFAAAKVSGAVAAETVPGRVSAAAALPATPGASPRPRRDPVDPVTAGAAMGLPAR
jgi:subtilisin family serine protease